MRAAGFTLVEMLLVVLLVLALATVTYFALAGLRGGSDFTEGVDRFETLLRMARAQAQRQGCRMRVVVDANLGLPGIQYEADPANSPQQFSDYTSCPWAEFIPVDLLKVTHCQLTADSAYKLLVAQNSTGGDPNASMDPVTFEADGTSDSAVIELAPLDDSDTRRVVMQLDGESGSIISTPLSVDGLDAFYQLLGQGLTPTPTPTPGPAGGGQ